MYFDTSAMVSAYNAGGTALLDKYISTAQALGYKVALTDAVQIELSRTYSGAMDGWVANNVNSNRLTLAPTSEGALLRASILGDPVPSNFTATNAGERSIAERLVGDSRENRISTVFSDDQKFWPNRQVTAEYDKAIKYNIDKVRYTNGEMLSNATLTGALTAEEAGSYRNALTTSAEPYKPGGNDYLKSKLPTDAQLVQLANGTPVEGVRTIGAFGRVLAFAGGAMVLLDAGMTTVKAATQLKEGDNIGAGETVSEFGGRVGGAILLGELGMLTFGGFGSVVPGVGTTVGGLFGMLVGGFIGGYLGEAGAKQLYGRIFRNGEPAPPINPEEIDPRLTDNRTILYTNTEMSDLQRTLFEAGYSRPQVNFFTETVKTRWLDLRSADPDAPIQNAIDDVLANPANFPAGSSQTFSRDTNGDGIADTRTTTVPGENETSIWTDRLDTSGRVVATEGIDMSFEGLLRTYAKTFDSQGDFTGQTSIDINSDRRGSIVSSRGTRIEFAAGTVEGINRAADTSPEITLSSSSGGATRTLTLDATSGAATYSVDGNAVVLDAGSELTLYTDGTLDAWNTFSDGVTRDIEKYSASADRQSTR